MFTEKSRRGNSFRATRKIEFLSLSQGLVPSEKIRAFGCASATELRFLARR